MGTRQRVVSIESVGEGGGEIGGAESYKGGAGVGGRAGRGGVDWWRTVEVIRVRLVEWWGRE